MDYTKGFATLLVSCLPYLQPRWPSFAALARDRPMSTQSSPREGLHGDLPASHTGAYMRDGRVYHERTIRSHPVGQGIDCMLPGTSVQFR
jgi:hypothetical protein